MYLAYMGSTLAFGFMTVKTVQFMLLTNCFRFMTQNQKEKKLNVTHASMIWFPGRIGVTVPQATAFFLFPRILVGTHSLKNPASGNKRLVGVARTWFFFPCFLSHYHGSSLPPFDGIGCSLFSLSWCPGRCPTNNKHCHWLRTDL
ncbi:hypothetical protein BCR43DRAFT_482884 [Syncephalastrum racemosum]|uniref:Uncharacterized protein n=1 Tax=Syncephalastrum racemosum TaxID=13706 RepID=A0A1X2HUE6_SYNRA|nr:hypothetical protein BCR43DRAFT_482884 [Syncephalastrum racemosum]